MITKRLTSVIAAASILALSGVNVSISGLGIQPMPIAQAASCDSNIRSVAVFTGTTGSQGANLRSDRSLSASVVGSVTGKVYFDAWGYGDVVQDIWTGQQDARWFRVQGTNKWVASAVIQGNPPGNPSLQPSCGSSGSYYHNPDAFFNWANGQQNIARLDTSDLKGECVTLIARYLQEVFLTGSARTQPIALNDGYGTAQAVATQFSNNFKPLTTSPSTPPTKGAVISFPKTPSSPYGHVAIVLETNGTQVRVLESNWNYVPKVTNTRWVSFSSSNGWTNPK